MTHSLAKKLSILILILTVGFTCATDAQAQKKVRFAYPSSADMGDIPSLLAWEQLKKQGIEVVPTFFPKTELAVQAVVARDERCTERRARRGADAQRACDGPATGVEREAAVLRVAVVDAAARRLRSHRARGPSDATAARCHGAGADL